MTDRASDTDCENAARLISHGLRVRKTPHRDSDYLRLARRYQRDPAFRSVTDRVARGLGLAVLGIETGTDAVVLAALDNSVFETRIEDYARRAKYRGTRGDHEKVLHGVIHLAIAALAFPRPDDLARDGFIGRVGIEIVDTTVRDVCRKLQQRAAVEAEIEPETPTDTPELEEVWRVYSRRPEASRTKDSRAAMNSTRAMVGRALNFLTESGFLTAVGEASEGNYRTSSRYQLQVRELAATNAFQELLRLTSLPMTGAEGTLRVVPQSHDHVLTPEACDV
ncbi:hypothetical protein ACIQF6_35425 [Kitasatospora sp. NPDC092948]|uniref:hypothetical protein n=1 Tax=Kitasatospora sp. NPDC092948 TaxID=3364088 RepID=UPI0037F4AB8B